MPTPQKFLLSPSKITDLVRYLARYPEHALPIDVLLDLLLYPSVVLAKSGYGRIFSTSEIEERRWKKSFEDLCNIKALEIDGGYFPAKEEMMRLFRNDYELRCFACVPSKVSEFNA
jgi:hypothetical protein